jgi:hypothetical protein
LGNVTLHGRPYDLGLGWFRPHEDFGGGMCYFTSLRLDLQQSKTAAT